MNILHDPIIRTVNTIRVPYESYLYLQEEMHRQRSESGKPLSDKYKERLRNTCEIYADKMRPLADGDLGGCNGDPHNAWEEHRWTSWSVKDMTRMLDDQGLPWAKGEPLERIYL